MSGAAATRVSPAAAVPSLRLRIAAIAVVIALAGLAAYAVFSGPTTVSSAGPSKAAPTRTTVTPEEQEPEGNRGD